MVVFDAWQAIPFSFWLHWKVASWLVSFSGDSRIPEKRARERIDDSEMTGIRLMDHARAPEKPHSSPKLSKHAQSRDFFVRKNEGQEDETAACPFGVKIHSRVKCVQFCNPSCGSINGRLAAVVIHDLLFCGRPKSRHPVHFSGCIAANFALASV